MRRSSLLLLLAVSLLMLATAAEAATHQVTVRDFVFEPADLTVAVGDTVTWTNTEGTHNVLANDGSFTSGPVAGGAWTFSHVFSAAGDFRYFCQLHGNATGFGMVGVVRVTGDDSETEPGNLRFAGNNFNVDEGNTATVTVQRVGGDDGAVSVSYATSDGTAVAGVDYSPRSGSLTWADGDDSPKSFQVPTIEDSLVESDETINVVLSNPTGGAGLGAPSAATITIRDDDATGDPGALSFAAATLSVGEGDGSAGLVVRRTGGTTGAVSARVMTHDGTATGGADFTPVDQIVSFVDGDAANKTVLVPILDDAVAEGPETFHAMLTAPTGGASLAEPTMMAIEIADDDFDSGPCVEDAVTHCLAGGRFRVTVDFQAPADPAPRPAQRIELTDDSGLFWFFEASNVEMLIKVLDACVDPFDRFWVFFAATTDVAFTVTVVDTGENRVKQYSNEQGQAALPVQDTDAFATCP
ncbi:MAG TPA: Calx-beta domain-containing protein [Thermoanaerobaculia bacterium]|nr:Calx-beta domain-containing protein [Thermoanaerobaculia bacterium]